MVIEGYSIVMSFEVLNHITNKLNGAGQHKAGALSGMFFRRQDSESSTKQVMGHLYNERFLALNFAEMGYSSQEFNSEAEKMNIRPYMRTGDSTGNSGYSTYDLSPSVRHFINDYCRILEPLVKLLEQKHPTVSAANSYVSGQRVSFNSYLKRLRRSNVATPLDYDFFVSMYDELWNDYKHAESAGVQAGGWSSDGSGTISDPALYSPVLNYFKAMSVEDFISKSLDNMDELLVYIA